MFVVLDMERSDLDRNVLYRLVVFNYKHRYPDCDRTSISDKVSGHLLNIHPRKNKPSGLFINLTTFDLLLRNFTDVFSSHCLICRVRNYPLP